MKKIKKFKDEKYKILIVVPKYNWPSKEKDYNYQFPVGLAYISVALKNANYKVDGLNLNHQHGKTKDILTQTLNKKTYDFVATGSNAMYYHPTREIIETVKKHKSKPKTILGGPLITSEPELIFNDLKPDFGVRDEGEEIVVELLEHLQKNKSLEKIGGLIYWDENRNLVLTSRRNPPMEVDLIPFPDFESFGFEEYLNNLYTNNVSLFCAFDKPRVYTLLGSRSCPFQCTFCYHENRLYRERSIDNIMKELNERVKKYKINRIIILDELFAINKERLEKFCKKIKELQKKVGWEIRWFAQLRASTADKKTLRLMKNSGCDVIGYGFESFSSIVLESMKKRTTPQQIEKAFNLTLEAGLGINANFIFGDVAETKETAYETLDWWKKNCMGQIYLDFIQPYPNSQIYQHCIKKGIIKDKLEFIKGLGGRGNIVLNMTDKMTDKQINQLRREILKALSKYRYYIFPKSMQKTEKNIYNLIIKCPYCKKQINYKNIFIKSKYFFGFSILCRKCHKHFYVTSRLKKIAYKNLDKINKIKCLIQKTKGFNKKLIIPSRGNFKPD